MIANFIQLFSEKCTNRIADAGGSIAYSELPALFLELDNNVVFAGFPDRNRTVSICPENRVEDVVLLLYLLSRNISLYINSSRSLQSELPPFVSDVLEILPGELQQIQDRIRLTSNTTWNKKSSGTTETRVVLSTSGSTGKRKFLCYQTDKLLLNALNCVAHFGFKESGRVMIPVPVAHMFGLGAGLLPAVMAGASILLIENANVLRFLYGLSHFKADLSLINPTLCHMLLKLNISPESACRFISAGEVLASEVKEQFTKRFGYIINLYGSSELGAAATTAVYPSSQHGGGDELRPLKDVFFRVDAGALSELLCRHNAPFDGYLDEWGQLTKWAHPGDDWYRTRDAGTINDNGDITVRGRIDLCINRSGFLISLVELENELLQLLPECSRIIVVSAGDQLIAHCQSKPGSTVDADQMRAELYGRLPRHAIPDLMVTCNRFPELPNGKIDRQALKNQFL